MLATAALSGCGGDGDEPSASAPKTPAAMPAPAPQATYRITVRNHWTAAAFARGFPARAHLTSLVGATHHAGVAFWAVGQPASPGIQNVAERGNKTVLLDEVASAIAAGTAEYPIIADGVALGVASVTLEVQLSTRYPLITLVSMLGPSPDWFIGVRGLSMLMDNVWQERLDMPLRVYDAGTDDGVGFTSANAVTVPRGVVQRLSSAESDTDLFDGWHRDSQAAVASILFERLS
jgi:hypothetical protein